MRHIIVVRILFRDLSGPKLLPDQIGMFIARASADGVINRERFFEKYKGVVEDSFARCPFPSIFSPRPHTRLFWLPSKTTSEIVYSSLLKHINFEIKRRTVLVLCVPVFSFPITALYFISVSLL